MSSSLLIFKVEIEDHNLPELQTLKAKDLLAYINYKNIPLFNYVPWMDSALDFNLKAFSEITYFNLSLI